MRKLYSCVKFLTALIFILHFSISPSVLLNSLLKTPKGLVPIQELDVGDKVITLGSNGESHTEKKIISISEKETDIAVIIETDKGAIFAPPDQLFWEPSLEEWVEAKNLSSGNRLLGSDCCWQTCLSVEVLNLFTPKYEISIEAPYVFYVSEAEVLTHNYGSIAVRGVPFVAKGIANVIRHPEAIKKIGAAVWATLTGLFAGKIINNVVGDNKVKQTPSKAEKKQTIDSKEREVLTDNTGKKGHPLHKQDLKYSNWKANTDIIKYGDFTIIKQKGESLSKVLKRFNIPYNNNTKPHVHSKQRQGCKKQPPAAQNSSINQTPMSSPPQNNEPEDKHEKKESKSKEAESPPCSRLEDVVSLGERGKININKAAVDKYAPRFEKLGLRNIAHKNIKHIRAGHYSDGSDYVYNLLTWGKKVSVFKAGENFIELALTAIEKGREIVKGKFIYDFDRIIGLNENGIETTKIRVILTKTFDSVKTAFPI